MNKKQKVAPITATNIFEFTTADREEVFARAKKNKEGFPLIYPTLTPKNERIVLTFIDAKIYDTDGKQVGKNVGNFDILANDYFDPKDPLGKTKVEFIGALLRSDRLVKGGVYYKGKFFTSKMTPKRALLLMKNFLHAYFYLEDAKVILKYFQEGDPSYCMPFWPIHSANANGKDAMSCAVNATVESVTGSKYGPFNFIVHEGEHFDLTKEDDQIRAQAIHYMLEPGSTVHGFYHKGVLVPEKMSESYRLYLEKGFIKKNFNVDQKDFLLNYITKDKVSGYPIYWPMFKGKKNRKVVVSVVNADGALIENKEQKNFDFYSDKIFDYHDVDNRHLLRIVRSLYFKDGKMSKGALYFDGVLVNGSNISASEKARRKGKVEKALRIVISDNKEFVTINKLFTIEDRERLLRLSPSQGRYYPDSHDIIENYEPAFKRNEEALLRFDRVNVVNAEGNYILAEPISGEIKAGEKVSSLEWKTILTVLAVDHEKIRGAIYYKGYNIANGRGRYKKFVKEVLPTLVSAPAQKAKEEEGLKLTINPRYGVPKYWPTRDKDGRNVLLSVVDADIHFKVGQKVVKAVNHATFDVYEGETFGLVGESGSGKTTITRGIIGLNKLTHGAIYFKGELISSGLTRKETHANKKNIQMIFQDPAASLNERANVDYIVSEGLYNFHLFKDNQERLDKITEMLHAVGLLPEHLSRYPHEFSGGQRQRIGIARALVIEPELVLADEPISALDVSIRAQVLNLLKELQERLGLTYVFIAHDLSIIRYISDRIAVMHKGYIVELGPAEEVYQHPLHPYTRSLLTAIPQPDPATKDERKKIPYNQEGIVYEECVWKEFTPGHFVYVNPKLESEIKERVKKLKK